MAIDTSEFDKDKAGWEKGMRLVRRDCQSFLSQVKAPFSLYKGMRGGTHELIKKRIRLSDRRPMELDPDLHDAVNNYFTEDFGEPFRNSLFATGDEGHAGYFGTVYAVFPIGKFTFLWSPNIDDLNMQTHDLMDGLYQNRVSPIPPTAAQKAEGLIKALRQVGYQTTDLQGAIASENEIMVRCEEYYALPIEIVDQTGMITPLWDILDEVP